MHGHVPCVAGCISVASPRRIAPPVTTDFCVALVETPGSSSASSRAVGGRMRASRRSRPARSCAAVGVFNVSVTLNRLSRAGSLAKTNVGQKHFWADSNRQSLDVYIEGPAQQFEVERLIH